MVDHLHKRNKHYDPSISSTLEDDSRLNWLIYMAVRLVRACANVKLNYPPIGLHYMVER